MQIRKRIIGSVIVAVAIISLTACGGNDVTDGDSVEMSSVSSETVQTIQKDISETKILTVYFSMPENEDISDVDAISGASIVVRDGAVIGTTEYVADIIHQTVGGGIIRIETEEQYPLEHESLVDYAKKEQNEEARPEFKELTENTDEYDTVILCYPNWWADLPMPVYTFLEKTDLGGKMIIPVVTHGGSGFSDTVRTIAELQPSAYVSDHTLSIARDDVAGAGDDIEKWALELIDSVQ